MPRRCLCLCYYFRSVFNSNHTTRCPSSGSKRSIGSTIMATFTLGSNNERVWDPLKINDQSMNYAVLLLNHSLDNKTEKDCDSFFRLWSSAKFRVAVDGGSNWLVNHRSRKDFIKPDLICGDFDSIKPHVLETFKSMGSRIQPTPDQDYTDFKKACKLVLEEQDAKRIDINYIVTMASCSFGRFDHVMAIMNTLFEVDQIKPNIPVLIYEINGSLTWSLFPGDHIIQSNPYSKWCGLIPIGGPSNLTSAGLKWDLNDTELAFGKLISSSNEFVYDKHKQIHIKTNKPVLWTMDMSFKDD